MNQSGGRRGGKAKGKCFRQSQEHVQRTKDERRNGALQAMRSSRVGMAPLPEVLI